MGGLIGGDWEIQRLPLKDFGSTGGRPKKPSEMRRSPDSVARLSAGAQTTFLVAEAIVGAVRGGCDTAFLALHGAMVAEQGRAAPQSYTGAARLDRVAPAGHSRRPPREFAPTPAQRS